MTKHIFIRYSMAAALLVILQGFCRAEDNYVADSQMLFGIARDLWSPVELAAMDYPMEAMSPDEQARRIRQAAINLEAATLLAGGYASAWADWFTLLLSNEIHDYEQASEALTAYSALMPEDYRVVEKWISLQLNQLQDRYGREAYLENEMKGLRNYPEIASDVQTQLGIMTLETGDFAKARQHFNAAFRLNRYNVNAMGRLLEMLQPDPNNLDVKKYLDTLQNEAILWRSFLANNPGDLSATINLIDRLQQLGAFALAQRYYDHALTLLGTAPENKETVLELFRARISFAYAAGEYDVCTELIEKLDETERQDLIVRCLYGKTLEKQGKSEEAGRLWQELHEKILPALSAEPSHDRQASLFAWYYTFMQADPGRALPFAEIAYQENPESLRVQALYAYCLLLHDKTDQAAQLLQPYENAFITEPLYVLCRAAMLTAQQQYPSAWDVLHRIPRRSTGVFSDSFVQLEQQLSGQISDEVKNADSEKPKVDLIAQTFQSEFNETDLDFILKPESFVRVSLRMSKGVYPFSDPLLATVFIANTSKSLMILGPGKWFHPVVLICGRVSPEGDAAAKSAAWLPLSVRYLNNQPLLLPGRTHEIEESLNLGAIRREIDSHPQQSYQIAFKAVLNPKLEGTDYVAIPPAVETKEIVISRKGFRPDAQRMKYYENVMKDGKTDQIISATSLIAGLIEEAVLAKQKKISYAVRPIDSGSLYQALVKNLSHDDFRVRAWTAYELRRLPLDANSQAAAKLVALLNDPHWFVRLMVLQTLDPLLDLQDYYAAALADDAADDIVKRQIKLLQGKP